MFHTLLESQHIEERHPAETALSVLVHATIFTVLFTFTTTAAPQIERALAERVTFARVQREDPPAPKQAEAPRVADVVAAAPGGPLPAKGFQVLAVPIGIPDALPPIDFSKAVTDEADFSGRGVAGGVARGVVGGVVMKDPPPVIPGTPTEAPVYLQTQVEKLASARPDNPVLQYPEMLRRAAVEGSVLVQFVVDTNGRADMASFKVLNSTHDLFTDAVRNHLSALRYFPAEIGGRKVRMLVQQPFSFSLVQ
ncbi:MAG TPA: energy transducer TonB [Gemmatimonadaceae bacterium]